MFRTKVEALKETEPLVYASLVEQRKQQEDVMDYHSRLVEITWDVVGSFITSDALFIDGELAMKCNQIAEACVSLGCKENFSILDVGCGDGVIRSYLRGKVDEIQYVGIDLSSKMIEKAKFRLQYEKSKMKQVHGRKLKDPTFVQGNFLTNYRCKPPSRYNCVLFNGVLQFFSNKQWIQVLEQTRSLIAVGSRVVISHVQGGDFVKIEKAGNGATCLSIMPTIDELNKICDDLKCFRLLSHSPNLDEFYLVILEAI